MQPDHLSTKIMIISRVKTSLLLCCEKKKQFQDFELVIFHDTIIWKFESDFVGLSSDTYKYYWEFCNQKIMKNVKFWRNKNW